MSTSGPDFFVYATKTYVDSQKWDVVPEGTLFDSGTWLQMLRKASRGRRGGGTSNELIEGIGEPACSGFCREQSPYRLRHAPFTLPEVSGITASGLATRSDYLFACSRWGFMPSSVATDAGALTAPFTLAAP